MMPDREKVKKGLECCLTLDSPCGDCPYYSYEDIQELDCERNLRHDAISMLKEQEAKTVESIQISRDFCAELTGYCPSCNRPLKEQFNKRFCGNCGQELKWK